MPGTLDIENRVIKLDIKVEDDPTVASAAIIHHTLAAILHQHDFPFADYPEIVELAVIGTGLGMPRNKTELVKQSPRFWDSTIWAAVERPFLDEQCLAFANALCAWTRDDPQASWLQDLATALKKPTQRSLKFLNKTADCFVEPLADSPKLDQPQTYWLKMATQVGVTKQIIAIRHLQPDAQHNEGHYGQQQAALLIEKLRSSNKFIVLHAIAALEFLQLDNKEIRNELTMLTEAVEEEIRCKAMVALSRLEAINEIAFEQAVKMLASQSKHVNFAAMMGLLSHGSIKASTLKAVDRGFLQSLQTCDYEFVSLFATAYNKWLNEPVAHVKSLLADQPEYMQIAVEAVSNAREQKAVAG